MDLICSDTETLFSVHQSSSLLPAWPVLSAARHARVLEGLLDAGPVQLTLPPTGLSAVTRGS